MMLGKLGDHTKKNKITMNRNYRKQIKDLSLKPEMLNF